MQEDIIEPNPSLRKLLEDIDKTKVKLWLFTNAYVNHGRRVVKLLGIDDLFEGKKDHSWCLTQNKIPAEKERRKWSSINMQTSVQDCMAIYTTLSQSLT